MRRPWAMSSRPHRPAVGRYLKPAITGRIAPSTGFREGATEAHPTSENRASSDLHLTEGIRFAPTILLSSTGALLRRRSPRATGQGIASNSFSIPPLQGLDGVSTLIQSRWVVNQLSEKQAGPMLNLKGRDRINRRWRSGMSDPPGGEAKPSIIMRRARGVSTNASALNREAFSRPVQIFSNASTPVLQEQMSSIMPPSPLLRNLQINAEQNEGSPSVLSGPLKPAMPLAMPFHTSRLRARASSGTAGAATIRNSTQSVSNQMASAQPAAVGEPAQTPGTEALAASGLQAQVNLDELAEKVWRKLMRTLTIEQERRGATRWP